MEIKAKGSVGTGVAVVVRRETRVLVGLRQGSHMAGVWCFPGGHLDYGESWIEAAKREVLEETGLNVGDVKVLGIGNNIMPKDQLQYTTVYLEATWLGGEAVILEPKKCQEWRWVGVSEIPQPHMTPVENLHQMGFRVAKGEGDLQTAPCLDFWVAKGCGHGR